jgi:hypothetical protein
MKVDGTAGKLINRQLTNGIVSNAVVDTKTDAAGNLWILTQVSKRIAFNGVFPKPTYRLAKLEPNTFKILESNDFVGSKNTAFSSFDTQTKLVNDNRNIQKIIGDSTELVFQLPTNVSLQQNMVWGKSSVWMLVYNSTSAINELYNYNFEQKKQTIFNRTNTLLNASISQIYLDAQENLWVVNGGTNLLLKFNEKLGWVNQNLTLSGTNRIIGESNGIFYLYNIVGLKRDVYSFGENGLKLLVNVPLVSTSGTIQLDKSGKIWLLQTDKLLKINPCNELKTPLLKASSSQISIGEQVILKAEGCSSAKWTWNTENKPSETQITDKNNVLLVKPQLNTQYWVQCVDQECVSDLSNLLEVNVPTLILGSTDKNKYCTNENIVLKFVAGGKYTIKNEFRAVFSNAGSKYTATIANDNSFKAAIPKEITSGKYWVKLESTEPKLTSKDSVEVQIFNVPTISISGLNEAYILDTTQVLVKLTGTPPYKFVFNGKELVSSMSNTIIRSFVPSEPINYNFSVSAFSDTNCANGIVENREINIRATINPKVANFWVKYFPVPFERVLDLQVYNKPGPKLTVTLFNTKGQIVIQKEYPIGSYLDKFKLDTADLGAGLYFLVLYTGKRKETKKVVKW